MRIDDWEFEHVTSNPAVVSKSGKRGVACAEREGECPCGGLQDRHGFPPVFPEDVTRFRRIRQRREALEARRDFQFLEFRVYSEAMFVIGADLVEAYFAARAGHRGVKAARAQFDAWLTLASRSEWRTPEDVKAAFPKVSLLKAGRAVFNIKGNDFRLIARIQYQAGVLMIRVFGTHAEYDVIDAETV